jgi:hypothetical protein
MTEYDETEGIEELAAQAVAPIEQELRKRLALELDDRAVLAIESALLKSFVNGMRAGATTTETAETADQGIVTVGFINPVLPNLPPVDPELPWMDPWAERYGDGQA